MISKRMEVNAVNCIRRPLIQAHSSKGSNNNVAVSSKDTLIEVRIGSKVVQRCSLEECIWQENKRNMDNPASTRVLNLGQATIDFFLPAGFPGSVSEDYLEYMLWQFPTNITGWICRALITSSLLQAVGLSIGPGPAAAATAAIKWVTKDGLGAVGRLFIGGRFGGVFDEDPKQWRMYAELVGSFGGLFELATPLAPDYFLPLASLGHLTKAIARGLKDPSFRVIQNHFAISENVGDVSAKEEVWEVAGQLIGLSLGVVLLSTPSVTSSYSHLAFTWTSIRSFHLWLRYQSLASLKLKTLNFKRLTILIIEHVQGLPVSGVADCNRKESLILPRMLLKPTISLGCSLDDIIEPGTSVSETRALLDIYESENHVLSVADSSNNYEVQILLKEGWTNITVLRGLYQAQCVLICKQNEGVDLCVESLIIMQQRFASFLEELIIAGWNIDKLVIKAPSSAPVYNFILNE